MNREGEVVERARLDGMQLADVEVIFRQQPKIASGHHFGSRLVFARDGTLFAALQDHGVWRSTDAGRLLRLG